MNEWGSALDRPRAAFPQKKRDPFLSEAWVVSQYVRQVVLAHRFHRDAVDKAVLFVGPGLVQGEPAARTLRETEGEL